LLTISERCLVKIARLGKCIVLLDNDQCHTDRTMVSMQSY